MRELEKEEERKEPYMSVDIGNSQIRVYRDESDKYFTYLSGNVFNIETKEIENRYFIKRKIKFADGKSVKNKAKILIKDGILIPYKFKIKDGNGFKLVAGEVFYIKDFEVLEDGVLEKQRVREFKPKADGIKPSKEEQKLSTFAFNEYGGVPPY